MNVTFPEFSIFHALVGMLGTMVSMTFGIGPIENAVLITGFGILHEVVDGDLVKKSCGAPYEGIKDVLSFLPAPFIYYMVYIVAFAIARSH